MAVADLVKDAWTSVSVKVSDIIANPGDQSLNTSEVLNLFIIEFSGAAHVQLDNIELVCGHKDHNGCGISPPSVEIANQDIDVFTDAVNDTVWTNGIGAWDNLANQDYFVSDSDNHVSWQLVESGETGHDTVVEVNFKADGGDGVFYIQSAAPVNLNPLSTGNLIFDIKVINYGSNTSGITYKVDCIFPCSTGEQDLGVVADNVWQTITVPVSQLVSQGLNLTSVNTGLVIFPTWGDQQGVTLQLDNIRWQLGESTPPENETPTPVPGDSSTIDFEADTSSYAFNDFDGGAANVITNPQATGINTSAQVGKMIKSAGQTWGGSTMTFATPVAIPASSVVTMKVWSARAVPVLVKFDDMNAERTVNHTGSGWEELSFDFTGSVSTGETRLTLIFDNGVMGDAAGDAANWTFYFDDFTTPSAEGANDESFTTVGTPFDFEVGGLGSDFTWAVFENEDNPALEFVTNPAPSTLNDSPKVAKFTARQAGQPWAGTETAGATSVFTMDATNSIVKIMVYKSVISDVALKFSVGAAAQPEIKVANTKINEWEELTFDFSSRIGLAETIGITSVIVFPDFESNRAADTVTYFDNITFGSLTD